MTSDDTNRRVAEACGMLFQTDINGGIYWIEGNCNRHFRPLKSEADAVIAAEKFGLFSGMMQCELEFNDGRWFVYLAGGQSTPVGEGTFCDAICQAIITLAAKAE